MKNDFRLAGILFKRGNIVQPATYFQKRNFILQLPSYYVSRKKYTEYPNFELVQDDVHLLDDFREGSKIVVSFRIKGRKWESDDDPTIEEKYYVGLRAYKIELVEYKNTESAADPELPKKESLFDEDETEIKKNKLMEDFESENDSLPF